MTATPNLVDLLHTSQPSHQQACRPRRPVLPPVAPADLPQPSASSPASFLGSPLSIFGPALPTTCKLQKHLGLLQNESNAPCSVPISLIISSTNDKVELAFSQNYQFYTRDKTSRNKCFVILREIVPLLFRVTENFNFPAITLGYSPLQFLDGFQGMPAQHSTPKADCSIHGSVLK